MNKNRLRSEAYKADNQRKNECTKNGKRSFIDEEQLELRVYYGKKTHLLVGILRHFKLGGFRDIGINTISQLTQWLYATGLMTKSEKGKRMPLKYSSLCTEVEKVWCVIQKEDTEQIDPYGYDVTIYQ